MSDDPYDVLGVKKNASDAEIKKAYKKLVRTSHPDLHPDDAGAEARFVKIAAAYELLKDPAKRAQFDAGEIDMSGQEAPRRQYYRDFASARPQNSARDFEGFSPDDIFSQFFTGRGAGGGQGRSMAGQDQRYTLEVPFMDAVTGGRSQVTLPDGNRLDVAIPAGLRDGQTLRLQGKGGQGFGGGPRGDAYVTVTVRPHPVFRREGDDILLTLPITIDEAVLGAKLQVPTITGDVSVTIPKGASSGKVLRLRGRGVARRQTKGDQLVELRIAAPPGGDPALEAFLREWRKDHAYDPRREMMKGVAR